MRSNRGLRLARTLKIYLVNEVALAKSIDEKNRKPVTGYHDFGDKGPKVKTNVMGTSNKKSANQFS